VSLRRRVATERVGDVRSLSDEALLAGYAVGAPDVTRELVTRFQPRLVGLAQTIVRDRRHAEDVAQEAFVRAWRHAETFDPRRGSVATWLLRITRNLAIDALRVRRPEPMDPDVLHALTHPTTRAPGPDHHGHDVDMTDAGALLDGLPPEQARALVLAAVHGHTAAEIGEIEGIPLGTAKTRIRLALAKARANLDRHEVAASRDDR
jgi:RNA polymerase sigma factor (sigma-70 family)